MTWQLVTCVAGVGWLALGALLIALLRTAARSDTIAFERPWGSRGPGSSASPARQRPRFVPSQAGMRHSRIRTPH